MLEKQGNFLASLFKNDTKFSDFMFKNRGYFYIELKTRPLNNQPLIERLSIFLELPKNAIGGIGGGKRKPTGLIDVAIIQTLIRKGVVRWHCPIADFSG